MERGPRSLDAARYLERRGARPREDTQYDTQPPAADAAEPATDPATGPATDARDDEAAAEVVATGADVSVSMEWATTGPATDAATDEAGDVSIEWPQKMARMPPLSHRLLAHNERPSGVCAASLVREACVEAPLSRYRAAKAALAGGEAGTVLRAKAVLDRVACAALRSALDANGTSTIDSVDELQEHVLYLGGASELEATLGVPAARALLALPEAFAQQQQYAAHAAHASHAAHAAPPPAAAAGGKQRHHLFDCFLRRYSSGCNDQL